jgi:hypothetical protein
MTTGTLSLAFFLAFGASSASTTDKAAKDVKVDSVVRYDTATLVDFKATVTGIREVPKTDPLDGLYLAVKTEMGALKSETFDVYVGPTDFLKAFEITFAKGDKIQVIGSKVKIDGVDTLLAREVSRQQTTVILRGKNGDPYWKTWAKPQQ